MPKQRTVRLATLGDVSQDAESSVLDEVTGTRDGSNVYVNPIDIKGTGMSGKKWLIVAAVAAAAWYILKKKK